MRRAPAIFGAALLSMVTSPARAQGAEQLEQLEPDRGRWQLEYFGIGRRDEEDGHSVQALAGITDHVALGIELEWGWSQRRMTFDGLAPTVLYRFTDAQADPVGVGIEAQLELDGDLRLAGANARLILEKRSEAWWVQGDGIIRHVREGAASGTGLAYGWALSRRVGEAAWLGLEGSGQAARVDGSPLAVPNGGHFLGPALTLEYGLQSGAEIELGLAYLRRLDGQGPPDSVRIFVQLSL